MVDHTIFIRHSYSYNQRIDHQSNVPSTVSQVYVVYVSDDFTIKSEENMLSEKEKKTCCAWKTRGPGRVDVGPSPGVLAALRRNDHRSCMRTKHRV